MQIKLLKTEIRHCRKCGDRMAESKKIRITLKKSVIGSKPNQRRTVKALGLGKINSRVDYLNAGDFAKVLSREQKELKEL